MHPLWHALALALALLVAAAFALLACDDPPGGGAWRDGHFYAGIALGFGAAAVAVFVLARARLARPLAAAQAVLAVAGVVLALSSWALLVLRAAGAG